MQTALLKKVFHKTFIYISLWSFSEQQEQEQAASLVCRPAPLQSLN